MNDNPSPLVPQGSLLEQKNKIRARFKYAFFCVLAIHIIPITLALLMQGCRKPAEPEAAMDTNSVVSPFESTNTVDTNAYVAPVETNMAPVTPLAPAVQEYVVVKGDSFSTIAKKFGVTVKQIEEANPNIQPTKLQIGQKLQIPPAAPAASAAAPAMAHDMATMSGEQTYAVKSGDTLTKIANEFGVTVKALRTENNLTTDRIRVGQKLKIPAKTAGAAPAPVETTPTPPAVTPPPTAPATTPPAR